MSVNPLNDHYSFTTPASIHDEEAMTALELAGRTAAKVNEMIRYIDGEIVKQHEKLSHIYDSVPETVGQWLDDHPEVTTTLQDGEITGAKLHETLKLSTFNNYATPEMFGAVGDGETDDAAAIQSAINSLSEGDTLTFTRDKHYKLNSHITIANKKRIKIVNGIFDNSDNPDQCGFVIQNCDNVTIEDCTFNKGQQIILLYTCNNIFVNRCVFNETGYAIIQQLGYVSNNVNITNNHAFNLKNDFVECNCEIKAPSENWVITGNVYKRGLEDIANEAIECRFFGATDCSNIIIANNVIEGARGTGAIHLEDCGDNNIIANNIIKNCNGFGYIAFMSSRHVLITNNIFVNETKLDDVPFIFATYSDLDSVRSDEDKIMITGNMFRGNKTQSDPLHLYSLTGNIIVDNNVFNDIDIFYKMQKMSRLVFRNNVVHCNTFINNATDSLRRDIYLIECAFTGNKIYGDILISYNFNGITCKRLKFSNNEFHNSVNIDSVENCIFHDNFFAKDKTLRFDDKQYYSKYMFAYNNFAVDVGKLPDVPTATPTTNEGE